MNYWLMKSEPSSFGVEALAALPKKTTCWDGVRNYQARNMLRDTIKTGDRAFLYHSSCALPGIVAVLKIVRDGYADHSAFDPKHEHFDAASKQDNPRWFMVDVQLEHRLTNVITLDALRAHHKNELRDLWLLRPGNRLSVMPVSAAEWKFINTLAKR